MTKLFFLAIVLLFAFRSIYSQTSFEEIPDFYFEYQFEELNKHTPIPLEYNEHVKSYIEIFTVSRKNEFGKIVGLSDYYFPIFESYLDKYQLPLELKYLPVVESGLNPFAVSKSAAVGLWQFKINAAKLFGLHVDSYVDERYDPHASSDAASKYLQYLYTTFNDWLLALAAYNGGPGEVRKAIERANGETNYWKIRPYLSDQAQKYVPAFIAALYVMNNPEYHGIYKVPPIYEYADVDTLQINYQVSFEQIQTIVDISDSTLQHLNPQYKLKLIPEGKSNTLVLPAEEALAYLRNENRIRAQQISEDTYLQLKENAGNTYGRSKHIHVVQKGEFFHKIALQYNCTIENIKAWNSIETNEIHPGQELIIWIKSDTKADSLIYVNN
jgi:membrane-bound lytic murein transglycosylase D